jgi:FkbM family methyltransferase
MTLRASARRLVKPHYIFHPVHAGRRLLSATGRSPDLTRTRLVELPWGVSLIVRPGEAIGRVIAAGKIYDPVVSEALYRLIDPGDTAADVGANIGYVTSIMAARCGRNGRVLAFEPQSQAFTDLVRNVELWGRSGAAQVEAQKLALSDSDGVAELSVDPEETNLGLATLESDNGVTTETVTVARLDDLGIASFGVIKIDVEGHELAVLSGAQGLLARRAIRDLVVEHDGDPLEIARPLELHGYAVMLLDMTMRGLVMRDRLAMPTLRSGPASFLATRDAERARTRLGVSGWILPHIGPGFRRKPRPFRPV